LQAAQAFVLVFSTISAVFFLHMYVRAVPSRNTALLVSIYGMLYSPSDESLNHVLQLSLNLPVGSLKVLDKELSRFLEDDGMTVAEVLVIWKRNFIGGFPTNSYLSPAVHPELVGKVTLINDCHDQLFLVALVQAVAVGAHLNNHSLSG
jgi:hypothetical protein